MKNFFMGIIFFALGVYLITQNTIVKTSINLGSFTGGYNPPFGLLLLPILVGLIMLFVMKSQVWGWLLILFGIGTILLGLLMGVYGKIKM